MPSTRPTPKKLSPEQALAAIASGAPAAQAFANLDLGQCQFHDEIDTTGYAGSVIPMEGFGGVAKGHLALTPEAIKKYKDSGVPYITVFPDDKNKISGVDPSEMTIFGSAPTVNIIFNKVDHFAIGLETQNMTWLRNRSLVYHYASTPSKINSISIGDTVLREGDFVTMDARKGRLYVGDLPIKPIPENIRSLDVVAKEKILPDFKVSANAKGYMSVTAASQLSDEGIGLYRSEDIVRSPLVVLGNNNYPENTSMDELMKIVECNFSGKIYSRPQMQAAMEILLNSDGGEQTAEAQKYFDQKIGNQIEMEILRPFYFSNEDQGFRHKKYPITYRLADLEAFVPELADATILTPKNKKLFYDLQIEAVLRRISIEKDGPLEDVLKPFRILVPSVRSAKELEEIKTETDKVAKKYGLIQKDGTRQYLFGAMIETGEAVEPQEAAAIAKLCDFVSFGTNDLTKELTGLKRDDLSAEVKAAAKAWMQDNSYTHLGDSPFDTLVPTVTRKMDAAVKTMRRANPKLEIGCCGRQVAANPDSIEAVIKIGLDNISVPPQDIIASRVIAAHYGAQKQLGRAAAR